jgi:TonB family protein
MDAGSIFICYRREDTIAYAGRLHDRLSAHFGTNRVFMDIDAIQPGEDFVDVLQQRVSACDVLIAVIGKNWLVGKDDRGNRRLDNPEDYVRLEIAAALSRNIRVIPALVANARMPLSSDLPADITALARRHAIEISDTAFHTSVATLIKSLEAAIEAEHGRRGRERRETVAQAARVRAADVGDGQTDGAAANGVAFLSPHGWFVGIGSVTLALAVIALIAGIVPPETATIGYVERARGPSTALRPVATASTGPARVHDGGDIRVPTKTKDLLPDYPAIAVSAGIEGVVVVEVTIGPDGKVQNARMLQPYPPFDLAVLRAVKQWEFAPTLLDGRAVPVILTATVRFSLEDPALRREEK